MTPVAWLIFIAAATLEVGGDAMIRKGLQKTSLAFIISGIVVLGCYGLVVNIGDSGANRTPIPDQTGHPFRSKSTGHSDLNRTPL